jgi:hypothetical protein
MPIELIHTALAAAFLIICAMAGAILVREK